MTRKERFTLMTKTQYLQIKIEASDKERIINTAKKIGCYSISDFARMSMLEKCSKIESGAKG